jgi:hypothetical protein
MYCHAHKRHYGSGRSSASRTDRLHPRRNPWYSFLENESTPGHMVLSVAVEKIPSVTPLGIDPETSLKHYATPGPKTCTRYSVLK